MKELKLPITNLFEENFPRLYFSYFLTLLINHHPEIIIPQSLTKVIFSKDEKDIKLYIQVLKNIVEEQGFIITNMSDIATPFPD